jgi:hypothetical protein
MSGIVEYWERAEAFTISMWVNSAVDTNNVDFASMFHSDGWEDGDIHWQSIYKMSVSL